MADITIKRGDSFPPIEAQLFDLSGPIDLTLVDVIHLRMKSTGPVAAAGGHVVQVVAGPVTVVDALTGRIRYVWTPDDTQFSADYDAEWEITWQGGAIETVPNNAYFSVTVMLDLG